MRAPALLSTPAPRPAAPAAPAPTHAVSDPDRWAEAGVEPSVEDLLADPLTALVMHRDRIGPADVLAAVAHARCALRRGGAETEAGHGQDTAPQGMPAPFIRPLVRWRPAYRRAGPDLAELPLVGSL